MADRLQSEDSGGHPGVHSFDALGQCIELIRVIADDVGHPVTKARRKKLATLAHEKTSLGRPAADTGSRFLRPRLQALLADVAAAGLAIGQADAHGYQFTWPGAQATQVLADVVLAAHHQLEVGAHGGLRGGRAKAIE
jgi:hypothetical protein